MSGFRDLEVWRLAHSFRLAVYRATSAYPTHERFALADQTRRAASSIAANIAEGRGRGSDRDFARFLGFSVGSANETEDALILAKDLGYLSSDEWESLDSHLDRIKAMLARLRSYLSERARDQHGRDSKEA